MPDTDSEDYLKLMEWRVVFEKVFEGMFHIGINICRNTYSINSFISIEEQEKMPWYKKLKYYELYLYICLGKYDITIGRLLSIVDKTTGKRI